MRSRLLMLIAAAGAIVVLGALAAGSYALYNLNSIVARNQARIIKLTSAALQRTVHVQKIAAHAGWGIWIEISGLSIDDDPAFGTQPFLAAPTATLEVDLLPMLRGHVSVHTLTLSHPIVRLLEDEKGVMNIDSIGGPPGQSSPVPAIIASFFVRSVELEDGTVTYSQSGQNGAPIEIRGIDGTIDSFGLLNRFQADLKFAFLSDRQNCAMEGTLGPVLHDRMFEEGSIPLDVKLTADPFVVDRLKALAALGSDIPADLSMPDGVSVEGTLKGTMDSASFEVSADLSPAQVAYGNDFVKPRALAMTVQAGGELGLVSDKFALNSVKLRLGDMTADLTELSFPHAGPPKAHIDTSAFSIADVARTLPMLSNYRMGGKAEMHGTFALAAAPSANEGTIKLTQVSLAENRANLPGISDLTASVILKDRSIVLTPATFSIAGARATAQASVDSLSPLKAAFQFGADAMRPAAFIATRPQSEVMNGLRIAGNARGDFDSPAIDARITSSSGIVNAIAYNNLDVTGSYANGRITVNPLKMQAFSGFITVNGAASTGARPQFSATTLLNGVDLYAALQALDPKGEHRLRGMLSGTVRMAGAGKDWNSISPSLNGNGSLVLKDGKVAGINIVAVAINKIAAAPGVSQIISAAFMSDHRGMLADPDTELKDARLTFVLANQRITTHDLTITSSDYQITGDGWFDFDRNISMSMDIQLTVGLSVTLPIYVRGKSPVILVVPDIPKLAERIAMGAISVPGRIIQGGVSGLNTLMGKGSSGSSGPSIPNPLDKLKGWIP